MRTINDKQDNNTTADGQLHADEFNDHKNELQNVVAHSGQLLTATDSLQLAKSMTIASLTGQIFSNTSTDPESLVLVHSSGQAGLVYPDNLALLDGMRFYVYVTNPNRSTACFLKLLTMGAKALTARGLVNLPIGALQGSCTIEYSGLADKFILVDSKTYSEKPIIDVGAQIDAKIEAARVQEFTLLHDMTPEIERDLSPLHMTWQDGSTMYRQVFPITWREATTLKPYCILSLYTLAAADLNRIRLGFISFSPAFSAQSIRVMTPCPSDFTSSGGLLYALGAHISVHSGMAYINLTASTGTAAVSITGDTVEIFYAK